MLFKSVLVSALLATGALAHNSDNGNSKSYSNSNNNNNNAGDGNNYANSNGNSNSNSNNNNNNSWGATSNTTSVTSSSTTVAAAAAAAAATTSTTSAAAASTATSASQVQVQVVSVSNANGSLTYTPDEIVAAPGSFVQFQFWPKNHTVTQSTFANPCQPITSTSNATAIVKSGFVPVAADATEVPVYTIQINDTKPIWLYCGQTGHCAKGMVMAINVNNSSPNTLAAYKAKAATFQDNSTSTSTSTSSGSSSTTSSSTTAQQTTNAAARPVAGWVGVALAAVAGLAILL